MAVWEHLQAIYSTWLGLMSGIFSVALTILGITINKSSYPRILFLCSAGFVSVIAGFFAWSNEHDKVLAFENSSICASITYKPNREPYLNPPVVRSEKNYAVFLELTLPRGLRRAYVDLQAIRIQEKRGSWSPPLNHGIGLRLGWPEWDLSWEPRDVTSGDFLVLFVTNDTAGKELRLFNREYGRDDIKNLNLLAPGHYKIALALRNETSDIVPIELEVDWPGDIRFLDILSRPCSKQDVTNRGQ